MTPVSKEEKAVLRETEQFVQKIITEVYGQRATRASVHETARRVMDALPPKDVLVGAQSEAL